MRFTGNGGVQVGGLDSDDRVRHESRPGAHAYWNGHIFDRDGRSGAALVGALADDWAAGRPVDHSRLMGAYFVYLSARSRDDEVLFTDSSGMCRLYWCDDTISTNFLELVRSAHRSADDLDPNGLLDFLHGGFCTFDRTLVRGVRRTDSSQVYRWRAGTLGHEPKDLPDLFANPDVLSVESFADLLIRSLSGTEVSLDLTGGIDSRLLAALLHDGQVEFEVAISGIEGNTDIEIAREAAAILGKDLRILWHRGSELGGDDLVGLFRETDGQIDMLEYHRSSKLSHARRDRGATLYLTGAGGELYKDFWWLQDFPRYRITSTRLDRLWDFRIEPVAFPDELLHGELRESSARRRADTIELLRAHVRPVNTESYDNIYYRYRMASSAATYLTLAQRHFDAYSPLLERNLVSFGLALPRRDRFFNRFHRAQLSALNPRLAALRTSEGISCSSRRRDILLDIPRYGLDKATRLVKQALRRLTGRTYFQQNPTDPTLYDAARSRPETRAAVEQLIEHSVLADDTEMEQLPDRLLGRVLTVGTLIHWLDGQGTDSNEVADRGDPLESA